MAVDPTTTKFMIRATINADGVVEKSDIIGAIFGQTDGLMGNELDLRDLQKSARIGRIEVDVETKGGKTTGSILMPSAMDKVESAILAAGIETIDRIGPCKATIRVQAMEDTRSARRAQVLDRAKELLAQLNEDPGQDSTRLTDEVRSAVHVADITHFRKTKLPCGPNVETSDSIILVEGRSDVLNLLKCGIKNALGVEGTSVHKEVKDLTHEKNTTIFIDGDRGGELIAKELLQTCEIDFVARAPNTREVEELPHKLVMKCLKNKVSADQFVSQMGMNIERSEKAGDKKPAQKRTPAKKTTRKSDDDGDKKPARGRGRKSDDDGDKKPARGRGRKADDDEKPKGRRTEAKKPARKIIKREGDPRTVFGETLTGLSGSLKAVLLDGAGATIKEGLAVRELADNLKSGKDAVNTVVFDGVITQRLLDIAADKKINTVVGVKMGNVTKVPDTVEILTKDDLQ